MVRVRGFDFDERRNRKLMEVSQCLPGRNQYIVLWNIVDVPLAVDDDLTKLGQFKTAKLLRNYIREAGYVRLLGSKSIPKFYVKCIAYQLDALNSRFPITS